MTWTWRADDFSRLFNPAYVGMLLSALAIGYAKEKPPGLPVALAFVGPSFCLHPQVRACLPRTTRKAFGTWLREQPGLKSELILASKTLKAPVRQALALLLGRGVLALNADTLRPLDDSSAAVSKIEAIGVDFAVAQQVGRWLAKNGTAADIYLHLGVRP